ncbi:MAG TPA: poly(R)-hydroxyalkanoic acid synthase subunit PhaE [Steroidobacteraceae bacterium]
MQTPGTGTSFKPEEAYAAAAERFFELMKTFGMTASMTTDWNALAAPLAAQFERWLQMSQGAVPWSGASAWGGAPGSLFGLGVPGAAAFGPLPVGPAAVQGAGMPRTFELLGRLGQLQGELAKHWSEIAATAAQRFIAKLGASPTAPASPQQALKLYELWVSCAEEVYAQTVHRQDFARLQAELANTSAALIAEQRQQAETLVRSFGLPTRTEVDALYTQLKELRRQLGELGREPRASEAGATVMASRDAGQERQHAAGKRTAAGTRSAAGKRNAGPKRSTAGKRRTQTRARRPRR